MTVDDLLIAISALLRINCIFLFLFLDYRMLHLRRRLDELPIIGPGVSLIFQRWSLQQALVWSNAWRCLSSEETIKTQY
jgi:hypothetical protein